MGGSVVKTLLVSITAVIVGSLAVAWLTNNVRAVRRAVGGL